MSVKKLPDWLKKVGGRLKQYRYAALILLLGLVLLMIPTGKQETPVQETAPVQQNAAEESVEERLERLLSQVKGAGRVSVMLTVRQGEETVYQTDETTEQQQNGTDTSRTVTITTVLASAGSSEEQPLPVTVLSPVYLGAVVVAEGGDQASVRLDLVNAVSSLTGLGADKITVIKMKTD